MIDITYFAVWFLVMNVLFFTAWLILIMREFIYLRQLQKLIRDDEEGFQEP